MTYAAEMPAKTSKTTQIAIRIEDHFLVRIDALVASLSPEGMSLARSEVMRAALVRGIESLEAQHAKPSKTVDRPTKKGAKKKP